MCSSDQESNSSCEESVPADLEKMLELLISREELNILDVAIVLDLTENLVKEESFHSVVQLVFPETTADVSHNIMRPVGVLNTVK